MITGRLAEHALRNVLAPLAAELQFEYEIIVLGISVAALMHADWVRRKLPTIPAADRVLLPGWCQGDLEPLRTAWGTPVELGPRDLFDLPEFFGRKKRPPVDLSTHQIEIIAEINHAPRLSESDLLRQAIAFRDAGADVIDLGCIPGESWAGVGPAVRRLKAEGLRLSIDTFDRAETVAAVEAGAELVLSANSTNRDWAVDVPAEFVVIPDDPRDLPSMEATAAQLTAAGRVVRWDPILEPIGFGFAASLERYFHTRRTKPTVPMMMGVGNLTELTEVDSVGPNFLLAAICAELGIGSILTTQVINWSQSAVREFDLARRLVHYSLTQQVLPKHQDDRLLLLRDARLREIGDDGIARLREQITDPNFRVFAERGEIHVLNRDGYWHGDDPYEVFDRVLAESGPITADHAFYLGIELGKARTALTLGKQYTQDEALRWGFLTRAETSAVERRKHTGR